MTAIWVTIRLMRRFAVGGSVRLSTILGCLPSAACCMATIRALPPTRPTQSRFALIRFVTGGGKKFAHSCGVKAPSKIPILSQRASTVRSAALRSSALSFEKAFSIGLKSGRRAEGKA